MRFWLPAAAGATLALIGYIALLVGTIPGIELASYKSLLLERVPSPRIIVDAGSNAFVNIDAEALGVEFNMNGVNIADNAGYPLVDKVRRVERFARPGDIVLLPLEWSYYVAPEALFENFVLDSFTLLPQYFWEATWQERIERVLRIPPRLALNILAQNISLMLDQAFGRYDVEDHVLTSLLKGKSHRRPSHMDPKLAKTGCANSIFPSGWDLRDLPAPFDFIIARLRVLRDRGIDVILAPPTVAGVGCYGRTEELDTFETNLARRLAAEGMHFAGRHADFWLPAEYTADTYYHVTEPGRAIATKRMINAVKMAGVRRRPSDASLVKAATVLEQAISELEQALSEKYDCANRKNDFAAAARSNPIAFKQGWSTIESEGRWMRGDKATFRFIGPDAPFELSIRGNSFREPRELSVTVNGMPLGRATTLTNGVGTITLQVPGAAAAYGRCYDVALELDSRNPGEFLARDDRTLTFFLTEVSALAGVSMTRSVNWKSRDVRPIRSIARSTRAPPLSRQRLSSGELHIP